MELGMIRLGRMGTNMARRLLRAGHQCVVYDLQPEAVMPRSDWMMVPASVVAPTLEAQL